MEAQGDPPSYGQCLSSRDPYAVGSQNKYHCESFLAAEIQTESKTIPRKKNVNAVTSAGTEFKPLLPHNCTFNFGHR